MFSTTAFIPTAPTSISRFPIRPIHSTSTSPCRPPRSIIPIHRRTPTMTTPSNSSPQTQPRSPIPQSPPPSPPPSTPILTYSPLSRTLLSAIYISHITAAFFLSPGSLADPTILSALLADLFAGNGVQINQIFFSIFSLTGLLSLVYAALLNPAASKQKRLPFVTTLTSLFLGFFTLGPYIISRTFVTSVSAEDVAKRGLLSRFLESNYLAVPLLLCTLATYAFGLGLFLPGDQSYHDVVFYASAVNLSRLIQSDKGVFITCLDFSIMSLVLWGPLTEDMARRGWFVEGKVRDSILTAVSFLLLPVLGPALYLATRPPLPGKKEKKT